MNHLRHLTTIDLLLIITTSLTGAALLYLWTSSTQTPKKFSALLIILGVALISASLWWGKKKHATVVAKEFIEIEVGGRHEILIAPPNPIKNPRLYLTSNDIPVMVEEVWWGEGGTLNESSPLMRWRRGVTYPGTLSEGHSMKILLRNEGSATARILARVATHEKK